MAYKKPTYEKTDDVLRGNEFMSANLALFVIIIGVVATFATGCELLYYQGDITQYIPFIT